MRHLRRIRIAYVLAAIGAVAIAGTLISTLGSSGSGSNDRQSVPPEHVDIGGGTGPRSCVVRAQRLSGSRTIASTRTATASLPVRVTVTARGGPRPVKASASTTVKETATVTGSARIKATVTGRGAVCARAKSPEDAQRRADSAARARARRQARALLGPALRHAAAAAQPALDTRTRASAQAAADRQAQAAVPAARADAERRAAQIAAQKAASP